MDHRSRMIERRQRQLARTPGFDPVPNKRIDAALMKAMADLPRGVDPVEGIAFAVRRVASTLPPADTAGRHRAPRPSRNDSAAYRRGNRWPVAA